MPATYSSCVIDARDIPTAADSAYQHVLDVYASEVNKIASVWCAFDDELLEYRPHPKSTAVAGVFKHELLSCRRFFGEFLGLPEPDAAATVPDPMTVDACITRLADLARAAAAPRSCDGGLVGDAGAVLRCRAHAPLDFLAPRAAQCASPDATDCIPADARSSGAADLRPDG